MHGNLLTQRKKVGKQYSGKWLWKQHNSGKARLTHSSADIQERLSESNGKEISRTTRCITNNETYTSTKCKPRNKLTKMRRLTWLGHMMRIHPDIPARKAIEECLRKVTGPRGRQKTTWMQTVRQDLNSTAMNLDF